MQTLQHSDRDGLVEAIRQHNHVQLLKEISNRAPRAANSVQADELSQFLLDVVWMDMCRRSAGYLF